MKVSQAIKTALTNPASIKPNESWWYNVAPALCIEPFTASATDLLGRISSKRYQIENSTIEGQDILKVMKLISETKRSALVKSQVTTPAISAGTPWILYAYKLHHGIPYSKWDKTDPNLKKLLGSDLEDLVDYSSSNILEFFTLDELHEFRVKATTAVGTGVHAGYKAYKMNFTGNEDFDNMPKLLRFMVLQTWIYHPSIRNPKAMILNNRDWDNPPEYSLEGDDLAAVVPSIWDDLIKPTASTVTDSPW